ncbi:hypothetical protein [Bartonella raoultii]|uniref:hypothetical protein n=1 Tax=Bartonella raoultii TaxID=1457020 RepID=UPI001ABB7DFE|nr:hypothetical protein [Bartonella raoultii]
MTTARIALILKLIPVFTGKLSKVLPLQVKKDAGGDIKTISRVQDCFAGAKNAVSERHGAKHSDA